MIAVFIFLAWTTYLVPFYEDDYFLLNLVNSKSLRQFTDFSFWFSPTFGHMIPVTLLGLKLFAIFPDYSRFLYSIFIFVNLCTSFLLLEKIVIELKLRITKRKARIAILFSLITIFSAHSVYYASLGLANILAQTSTIAAVYFYLLGHQENRKRFYSIASVLTILTFGCFETYLLNVLLVPLYAVVLIMMNSSEKSIHIFKAVLSNCIKKGYTFILLILIFTLVYLWHHSKSGFGANLPTSSFSLVGRQLPRWILNLLLPMLGGGIPVGHQCIGECTMPYGPLNDFFPSTVQSAVTLIIGVLIVIISFFKRTLLALMMILVTTSIICATAILYARYETLGVGIFSNIYYISGLLPYTTIFMLFFYIFILQIGHLGRSREIRIGIYLLFISHLAVTSFTYFQYFERFSSNSSNLWISKVEKSIKFYGQSINIVNTKQPLPKSFGENTAVYVSTYDFIKWKMNLDSLYFEAPFKGISSLGSLYTARTAKVSTTKFTPCTSSDINLPVPGDIGQDAKFVILSIHSSESQSVMVQTGWNYFNLRLLDGTHRYILQTISSTNPIKIFDSRYPTCVSRVTTGVFISHDK